MLRIIYSYARIITRILSRILVVVLRLVDVNVKKGERYR